ncbi:MAG: hypothetical protein Q9186_005505 [Xanthomendoza sp. 1 TL-2023]
MVVPSRLQHTQASDAAGSKNPVGKSDAMYGNPLMDSTFPDFGRMWPVTQGWNNIPLENYNFDLPFQQDYSNNNSFIQNQQNEHPDDDDGIDDFYDSEVGKTNELMNLTPEFKGNTASVASQIKISTPTKATVNLAKGSATDTKRSAAELRAFLLAKKRPGSATPSASLASNKDNNDGHVMNGGGQGKTAEERNPPLSGDMKAGPGQTATSVSTDKSLQKPSNAQSLPTQNADIQGLIDEYRAPETVKNPSVPGISMLAPDTLSNGKTNGANNAAAPKPIATVDPVMSLIKHAGSPGSLESGEIHSDQEAAIKPTGLDQANRNAEKVNNEPPKSAEKKISVDNPDRRQKPKTPQIRAEASKQAVAQTKSGPVSLFQSIDPRKSTQSNVEHRNVPLAQRITRTQQEDIPSSSPRDLHGDNPHRLDSDGRVDKRDHQHSAKASSSITQPRLLSRTTTDERPDHHKHERKQNEELAALYKRQLAEQNTPSSRTNGDRRTLNELTIKSKNNGVPADDTPTKPVGHHEPASAASEVVSNNLGSHGLTRLQHEQMQKLGIDLSPQGLGDLYDFLEYHRFYVEQYREGFFARQRRLKALDAEKVALERESLRQFDHFNSMRAQSLAARECTEPPTPVSVARNASVETPPVKPMPPPLTLPKRNSNGGVIAISGKDLPDSAVSTTNSTHRTNGVITPRDAPQSSGSNLKRDRPNEEWDLDNSRKVARVDSDLRSNGKDLPITTFVEGADHRLLAVEALAPVDEPLTLVTQPLETTVIGLIETVAIAAQVWMKSDGTPQALFAITVIGPAISRLTVQTSVGTAAANTVHLDHSDHPTMKRAMPGRSPRIPLIIILWYRTEAIEAGTGVNLDILTEAFNTCRNVILVFSVNNSRAFQGYARMLSLPSPSIPAPSWQSALLWDSTDPFRIEWITVKETRFHKVGHLKNECNEGQAVLVGRDGQEIEEGCGRALCRVIDGVEG